MKLYFLTLLPLLLLFSCTTTRLNSNKDPDFTRQIGSFHVIIRGSHSSDVYLYSLADYLREDLNKIGVKTTVERPNPLSLESEKEMLDRIARINPEALMVITQTEVRQTVGGYSMIGQKANGATLDIKLFQPNSDKPFWRANCRTDSDWGQGGAGKQSAKKIIEKLIADQLIQNNVDSSSISTKNNK